MPPAGHTTALPGSNPGAGTVPGETLQQMSIRLANAQPGGPAPLTGASTQSSNQTPVPQTQTDMLIQRLLGTSDVISSQSTGLESKFAEMINGVKSGQQAGAAAIDSNYNRQEALAQQKGDNTFTSAQEAQRGFAVNTAALKQINDNTATQVKDLEQRKQELILQGQAAAAGQISQLQLQSLQFQQQAQQQVFSNILGMVGISQKQDAAATQASQFQQTQNFAQSQAVSNIALKYGLSVNPGETLQSITTRAMPYASQEEQLQLKKMQSDISLQNAQTAKALADANGGGSAAPADIFNIATAALKDPDVMKLIKDPKTFSQVVLKATEIQKTGYTTAVTDSKNTGITKSQAQDQVRAKLNDGSLSQADASGMLAAIESVYGADVAAPAGPAGFNAPIIGTPAASKLGSGVAPADAATIAALHKALQGTAFGK